MMEAVSSYFQKLRQKTGGNQVKRGKKLCSILLAVCMLLCMLPTAAFAAGSGDYMKIAMLDSGRKYFTPDWVKSFITDLQPRKLRAVCGKGIQIERLRLSDPHFHRDAAQRTSESVRNP